MVCPNYRERYQNASEALAELRNLDQPVSPLPTIKLILIIIITAGVGLLGFIVFPYLTHDDRKLTKTYTNPEANMKFTIKYPDGWVEKPIESENEEKLKLSPKNISEKDDCPLELSVNINDLTTRRPLPSLLEYAKNTAFKKIHDDPANTGIELSDKAELNHEDAYQITHQRKENNQCTLKRVGTGNSIS